MPKDPKAAWRNSRNWLFGKKPTEGYSKAEDQRMFINCPTGDGRFRKRLISGYGIERMAPESGR